MSQEPSIAKTEGRDVTGLPEAPGLSHAEILELPISTLAYLGDAVYELYVRRHLLLSGHVNVPSHHLYLASLSYVSAEAQAKVLRLLEPSLTTAEAELCRRARNHVPLSRPRHADPMEYRLATALEALLGELYCAGQTARLDELMKQILGLIESAPKALHSAPGGET